MDLASLRVSAAQSRGELWWVIGLTLLAGAVRLPHLNGPMRFDEAVSSIYYVRRGLVYVLAASVDYYFMLDGPPRCRRYDPSNPPGVVWLVVPKPETIEEIFDVEGIPRTLMPQFRQHTVFPRGDRVFRYQGPAFPAKDQMGDAPRG